MGIYNRVYSYDGIQNTMELILNNKLIYLGKNCVIVSFIKVHVFHGFSPLCLKLQVAEGVLACKE